MVIKMEGINVNRIRDRTNRIIKVVLQSNSSNR